jgi:hypothetical protein
MLQQVLGLQPPDPYARPPPLSTDLELRFNLGVREFGAEKKAKRVDPMKVLSRAAGVQGGKTSMKEELRKMVLKKIREGRERGRPVEMMFDVGGDRIGAPDVWATNPPVWPPGLQDAACGAAMVDHGVQDWRSHPGTQIDVDQQAPARPVNVSSSAHSYSAGIAYDPYADFVAETTLTGSGCTQLGSSSFLNTNPTTTAYQAHASLFASTNDSINYDCLGAGYNLPRRSSSLANLTRRRSHLNNESTEIYHEDTDTIDAPNISQRVQSAPTALFPPSHIGQQEAWDLGQPKMNGTNIAAPGPEIINSNVSTSVSQFPVQYFKKPAHTPPQIKIQEPSPQKQPTSKKRSATQSIFTPVSTKARASDSTMGLPVLGADSEFLWKTKFPGNTYALLTLLLSWSLSMQRMQQLLPDLYLFSLNPAFPSPIKPPYTSLSSPSPSTTPARRRTRRSVSSAPATSRNAATTKSPSSAPQRRHWIPSKQNMSAASQLCAARSASTRSRRVQTRARRAGRMC